MQRYTCRRGTSGNISTELLHFSVWITFSNEGSSQRFRLVRVESRKLRELSFRAINGRIITEENLSKRNTEFPNVMQTFRFATRLIFIDVIHSHSRNRWCSASGLIVNTVARAMVYNQFSRFFSPLFLFSVFFLRLLSPQRLILISLSLSFLLFLRTRRNIFLLSSSKKIIFLSRYWLF